MSRIFCLSLVLGALAALAPQHSWAQDGVHSAPEGFTALFNGTDLNGWHGRPHLDPRQWDETAQEKKDQWQSEVQEHWTVKDGALVNDGHGAYLTTNKEYGDIELLIDFKT
ncbi:MAG: DUF1080 domain-containing protein, partial [Planctomycetales bacterium]|nr:DUF1080 domain-containing protein [Planctomycetales bacterium]